MGKSKSFDGSCPISGFIPVSSPNDLQNIQLSLEINGEVRQGLDA